MARTGLEKDRQKANATVYWCSESLRIAGILLQPFMPNKASQLLDIIGVEDSRRSYSDAKVGADVTYGVPRETLGKGALGSLFPPLSVEK
jgi:methionyl-tRNA synthetase